MERNPRIERKTTKRNPAKLILFIFFLIASIVVLPKVMSASQKTISPLAEDHPTNPFTFIFAKSKNPDDLKRTIVQKIGNAWKNYSVLVVDYNSDFRMSINESVMFTAASVNKLPILAALYFEVQKQSIDLDKVITLQEEDIQDYGTGSIRYDPPGTTYSVQTLARLMIQKSDNTAAHLLANYVIGLDSVQSLINSWGMTQTNMVNNKTSNQDMAILMKKIISRNVVNDAYTQEMLAFMKDSDFEDRLPALLPKDVAVYHKIGTGVGGVHDVGLVLHGKTKYYVGIFTTDISDEEQASKLLSEVSKTIYDFMK